MTKLVFEHNEPKSLIKIGRNDLDFSLRWNKEFFHSDFLNNTIISIRSSKNSMESTTIV